MFKRFREYIKWRLTMLGSAYISKKITNNLEKNKLIDKEETEIYAYCLYYVLENIFFTNIIALIGSIFHALPISILFLFIITLRRFTGGFHASTQNLCTFLSFGTFIIIMLITKLLIHSNTDYILTFTLIHVTSCIVIFLLAPVEHKNKQLSTDMKQLLQKKSRLYLSIITIANYIFFSLNLKLYYTTTTICVMIIAINLLVAYRINLKEEV